jgi:hypothetical protein
MYNHQHDWVVFVLWEHLPYLWPNQCSGNFHRTNFGLLGCLPWRQRLSQSSHRPRGRQGRERWGRCAQQAYLLRIGMRGILLTHWLSWMLQLQHLLVLISRRQTVLADMHLVQLVRNKRHCRKITWWVKNHKQTSLWFMHTVNHLLIPCGCDISPCKSLDVFIKMWSFTVLCMYWLYVCVFSCMYYAVVRVGLSVWVQSIRRHHSITTNAITTDKARSLISVALHLVHQLMWHTLLLSLGMGVYQDHICSDRRRVRKRETDHRTCHSRQYWKF